MVVDARGRGLVRLRHEGLHGGVGRLAAVLVVGGDRDGAGLRVLERVSRTFQRENGKLIQYCT